MLLAFQMGLSLSMNPFVLSSALGYVTVLSFLRHTPRQIIFSGIAYIGSLWLTHLTVLLGGYDRFIFHPVINKIVLLIDIILAVLWAVLGWRHAKDWRGLKQSEKRKEAVSLPR